MGGYHIISAITTDFEDATSEFLFNDMGEFTDQMTGSSYMMEITGDFNVVVTSCSAVMLLEQ